MPKNSRIMPLKQTAAIIYVHVSDTQTQKVKSMVMVVPLGIGFKDDGRGSAPLALPAGTFC